MKNVIAIALVATLASTAFAQLGQLPLPTVVYEDFTDDTAGTTFGADTGWGQSRMEYHTQRRNAAKTYLGVNSAETLFGGTNSSSLIDLPAGSANATLEACNVWVYQIEMISDIAWSSNSWPYFGTNPGFSFEDRYSYDDTSQSYNAGPVMKMANSIIDQNIVETYAGYNARPYVGVNPAGAEVLLPTTHAAAATALDSAITMTVVYSVDCTTGGTSVSFTGNQSTYGYQKAEALKTTAREVAVQAWNRVGSPASNVTYAAGYKTGVDVAYAGEQDLDFGLTSFGLYQASVADVNLDGVTNGADYAIYSANVGNPGTFFDGDTNGDGLVDINDLFAFCDLSGDCVVGDDDLSLLLSTWGIAGAGDINGSGSTDDDDLSLLLSAWDGSCTSPAPVPEPATLALLGLGALLIRRK